MHREFAKWRCSPDLLVEGTLVKLCSKDLLHGIDYLGRHAIVKKPSPEDPRTVTVTMAQGPTLDVFYRSVQVINDTAQDIDVDVEST